MPLQNESAYDLLRAAYAAFNSRDIDAALALMTSDVSWPRAFTGGFVRGPDEIRTYWIQQWSEIDPLIEPTTFFPVSDSHVDVVVRQVVRDLNGNVFAEEDVGHSFTIDGGLIQRMDILASLPNEK